MSKEINLQITKKGGVQMLHDDTLDLCELGCDVQVQRASHVEFNNETKFWYVQSAKTLKILRTNFKSREDALNWEKQYYGPNGEGWEELTKEGV